MSLFGYVSPQTLDEAIRVLGANPRAMALAGGNHVLLPANRDEIAGALLVDLRKLQRLTGVQQLAEGALRIGAMSTIASLIENELIREHLPGLAGTARIIGDAQVRNRATVGGNIASSELGADLGPVLLALNARIEVAGSKGSREIPADEFFARPGPESLGPGELIVAVTVPRAPGSWGFAYEKMKHPATLFALCGVAVAVQLAPHGTITDVRIAVTGALDRPTRLHAAEQGLRERSAEDATASLASAISDSQAHFVGDLFASAIYRRHLTFVLSDRALKRAIATATA